jgi:hypothetical protein
MESARGREHSPFHIPLAGALFADSVRAKNEGEQSVISKRTGKRIGEALSETLTRKRLAGLPWAGKPP